MTPANTATPPAPEELDALLRLLDDETPEVRSQVSERLSHCGGDISEWLAEHPRDIEAPERELLTRLLGPARRDRLESEWLAPTGGSLALREDWDRFEALLRTLSDFLHDGITVRQPLSDALDLLAEEAAGADATSAIKLRHHLFEEKRLVANSDGLEDPRNSDLAWAIADGRSNPLGLCIIFILTGRRLDLEIEPVNFPGHFLSRIFEEGYPIIVDCFDKGRLHLQSTLLESPELGKAERRILTQASHPGTMLVRLLNNLESALQSAGREDDRLLIRKLRDTLN